jgi:hypothetical protein
MAGLDPATQRDMSTSPMVLLSGARTRACWVAASRAAMVTVGIARTYVANPKRCL